MAAPSAARSLQAIKPHLPLIKFRKGGPMKLDSHTPSAQTVPQSSSHQSGNAIEDSQLPPRYARKPISDIEIAYIMRGGPE